MLAFLMVLSLLILSPVAEPEAAAETRITITVAAGGVACGLFLFVQYAFRVSMTAEATERETTAVLDLGPEGFRMRFPRVRILAARHAGVAAPSPVSETVEVDLLKWRF
ncbi:MAG: hypothetical protein AB1558_01175 [Thermodesulfobacteriota bacterium]